MTHFKFPYSFLNVQRGITSMIKVKSVFVFVLCSPSVYGLFTCEVSD